MTSYLDRSTFTVDLKLLLKGKDYRGKLYTTRQFIEVVEKTKQNDKGFS